MTLTVGYRTQTRNYTIRKPRLPNLLISVTYQIWLRYHAHSAEFGYGKYRALFWVGLGGISHSFDLVLGILAIEGLAKIRSLLYCRSVPKTYD